jgi:hypothetical protein
MRRNAWIALALAVILAATIGAQWVHKDKRTRYVVAPLPAAWTKIAIKDADFAYFREEGGVSVVVNSTCGVQSPVPPVALMAHLMIDLTDRHEESRRETRIDDRAALAVVLSARLDGAAVKMDLRVVQIDACVYDFSYVAPPDGYGQGHDDFDALVGGFHADRR